MESIITIIQTVGFPIACTIAMFLMLQNEQKSHKDETAELNKALTDMRITFNDSLHTQQTTITEAINNNTLVIQKLLDRLEQDEK